MAGSDPDTFQTLLQIFPIPFLLPPPFHSSSDVRASLFRAAAVVKEVRLLRGAAIRLW
jgi:hypothetical protein